MYYDVEEDSEPLVEDRLPVRQEVPIPHPSDFVADEITSTYFVNDLRDAPMVTLARTEVHLQDIATSTFESLTHPDVAPR